MFDSISISLSKSSPLNCAANITLELIAAHPKLDMGEVLGGAVQLQAWLTAPGDKACPEVNTNTQLRSL